MLGRSFPLCSPHTPHALEVSQGLSFIPWNCLVAAGWCLVSSGSWSCASVQTCVLPWFCDSLRPVCVFIPAQTPATQSVRVLGKGPMCEQFKGNENLKVGWWRNIRDQSKGMVWSKEWSCSVSCCVCSISWSTGQMCTQLILSFTLT